MKENPAENSNQNKKTVSGFQEWKQAPMKSNSIQKRVVLGSFLSALVGILVIVIFIIINQFQLLLDNVKTVNLTLAEMTATFMGEVHRRNPDESVELDPLQLLTYLDEFKKTKYLDKKNIFLFSKSSKPNTLIDHFWDEKSKEWIQKNLQDAEYQSAVVKLLEGVEAEELNIYQQISLSSDDFIGAFSRITGKDNKIIGVVMIKKEMREYLIDVLIDLFYIFLASIFALFVSFIIGLKVSDKILKPIQSVVVSMKKVSSSGGDLTSRINYLENDEIGELGRSFDSFVEALQDIIVKMISFAKPINSLVTEIEDHFVELVDRAHNQAASVEEVTATNEELTGSIRNISDTAAQQISMLDENMPVIDSLIQFILMVEKNAGKVNDMSTSALLSSNNGKDIIKDMVREMEVLDESSAKIAKIINIVRDVSDQTRLLSLNAAIEAARAKEHGKGFAVVADEVSSLAEKTAEQVKGVSAIIRENNEHISKAMRNVERSEQAFLEISSFVEQATDFSGKNVEGARKKQEPAREGISRLKEISKLSDIVANSMKEQATNADEMAITVEHINSSTQKITENVEQLKDKFQEVKNLYRQLQGLLGRFKVN